LLILVNPLIEISLQEVNLLRILQQSWPELLLELLLPQNHLDVLGRVVDLAGRNVDLIVEIELHLVIPLERLGVTGEGERLRLQIELQLGWLDIRYGDGQVDEVLFGLGLIGSLSPEDC